MADNLEVDEGTSGKVLRTLDIGSDQHVPKHQLRGIDLPTSIEFGQKTVSSSGTAEQLVGSSTTVSEGVVIKALASNSTAVYVGDSGVTTSNGFELIDPGEQIFLAIDDLQKVYIDVDTGGEGVSYIAT